MSENRSKSKRGYLKYIGILFLLLGLIILSIIYSPVIKAYIDYKLYPFPNKEIKIELTNGSDNITTDISKDTDTVFVDKDFGLYIPKIKANAKVIKNIDPNNYNAYRNALVHGVVHAKGTSLPDESGNVFLFAHSTVNFYERRQYNIYFYLLGQLEENDLVYVSYQGEIYTYKVLEFKVVKPDEVKYLGKYMDEDTLTLMTCWPVGGNSHRGIVIATRVIE